MSERKIAFNWEACRSGLITGQPGFCYTRGWGELQIADQGYGEKDQRHSNRVLGAMELWDAGQDKWETWEAWNSHTLWG